MNARVTLQVIYHSSDPSQQLQVRQEFPLEPEQDKLLFTSSADLRDAVGDGARVLFWLARPPGAVKYTFVAVGDRAPLAPLALQFPSTIDGTAIDSLVVGLQAATNQTLSLSVGSIASANTAADAKTQFPDVQVALLSNKQGTGAFQLLYMRPNLNLGPGGLLSAEQCAQLRASSDAGQQWLASIFC